MYSIPLMDIIILCCDMAVRKADPFEKPWNFMKLLQFSYQIWTQ